MICELEEPIALATRVSAFRAGGGREGWVELVRQRVVYGMIARWGRLSDRDAGCRHAAAGTCWAQACARLQPRILTTLRKAAGGGRPLEATHGTSSDGARVCKGRANGRGAAARRCTGQATMCRLQAGKQSEGQAGAYRREAAAAAAGSGSRGSGPLTLANANLAPLAWAAQTHHGNELFVKS